MTGEHERIARLRAIYGAPATGLGIGDDAAVLAPGIVLSVDAAIEDVHFRRAWIGRGASWRELGARAALAALSDLAAMAAAPRAMLSAITLPRGEPDATLYELAEGIAAIAGELGAPVIGGNLARGTIVTITTTVIGAAGAHVLRRDGARAGDAIWVTGTLGGAALGLAALEAGAIAEPAIARFLRPMPRFGEAAGCAAMAHAAIDVSDGLLADLGHVCGASAVGAELEESAIPREPDHDARARRLGLDPRAAILAGGEDYELVIVAPEGATITGATRIGAITAARGIAVRDPSGAVLALDGLGFDHFG
jgi:thiamine-monophosphate kinase